MGTPKGNWAVTDRKLLETERKDWEQTEAIIVRFWVYAISILLLLIPVLLATLRPALRAASINPVDALRTD